MSKMLINKAAVRRFVKDTASQTRTHKFTRVAGGFYDECEGHLRRYICDRVRSLPSAGKTIR